MTQIDAPAGRMKREAGMQGLDGLATYDAELTLDLLRHIEGKQGASVFDIDLCNGAFFGPSGKVWSAAMARMNLMLLLEAGCVLGRHQAAFVFAIERLTGKGYEKLAELSAKDKVWKLAPEYHGVGINLPALWQRLTAWWRKDSR
ncbi:hypothetical protein ABNQ38_33820 (plasmid) [Azospirillum sp. A29]|uniref:hypothetical protein n=1 Tax=Azospirillum sp. A29 TaxID=3160606 RepID=UPI00366A5AEB